MQEMVGIQNPFRWNCLAVCVELKLKWNEIVVFDDEDVGDDEINAGLLWEIDG